MSTYTYGAGAADGYLIVIDDTDAAAGNVTLQSTIPGRTPATITRGGFGDAITAKQAAHRILREHLNAPTYPRSPNQDCLALVELEREAHRDPAIRLDLDDAFTRGIVARIAAEHADFDAREAALS